MYSPCVKFEEVFSYFISELRKLAKKSFNYRTIENVCRDKMLISYIAAEGFNHLSTHATIAVMFHCLKFVFHEKCDNIQPIGVRLALLKAHWMLLDLV